MTEQPEDRRTHPRVTAGPDIFVSINGESARIANLSEDGISLHGPSLTVGSLVQIEAHIDKQHFVGTVKILRSGPDARSHGQFINLDAEAHSALQQYVNSALAR